MAVTYTCHRRNEYKGTFFYDKLYEDGGVLKEDFATCVNCHFCEQAFRDGEIQEECWKALKEDEELGIQYYVCAGCIAFYLDYKALGVKQMSEVGANAIVICDMCLTLYEKTEIKKEWFRPDLKGGRTEAIVVCTECSGYYLALRVLETYEHICDTCHTWLPRIRFSKEVLERFDACERFHMQCLRCSGAVAAWGREHTEIIPCAMCDMGACIGIGGLAASSSNCSVLGQVRLKIRIGAG